VVQTDAITLAPEGPDDWWEVEALYDLCFAPGRSALSSYRLRDGVDPIGPLCLTARDGAGILAGAIRHWPVLVGGARTALLGPIAVHPTRQGEGLAAMVIMPPPTNPDRVLGIALRADAWNGVTGTVTAARN